MKNFMKSSALVLTGVLLIAACGNKEQKSEANVNENPTQEKVEVKAVEGRKNFSDKAVITPLPAIMIATWDENKNPDVMMVGNIIWVIFGGLHIALEYFIAGLILMITIIGIPFGLQSLKLGMLAIWPFGTKVKWKPSQPGCLSIFLQS